MVSSWERNLLGMPQASSALPSQSYGGFDEVNAARARRARDVRQENKQRRLQVRQTELDRQSQERLQTSFSTDMFPGSGTGREYRQQPMTAEEQARRREMLSQIAFGPERRSVRPWRNEASLPERVLRDWVASEQEFRLAAERAGESRFGSALGWGALGMAGVVPFYGDAAQALGKAGRIFSSSGDAARSTRVSGKNIIDDVVEEKRQFLDLQNTLPPEQLAAIPANQRVLREIIHRQGFDAPTMKVNSSEFNRLANSGEYDVVYRGVFGEEGGQAAALRFAEDMVDGNMFVGQGRFGDGVYLAMSPEYSLSYAAGAGRAPGRGAIVRFLVPKNARFVEYPISPDLTKAFENSGMRTISEFLAASGYDGVRVSRSVGEGEIVLFNRSNLVTDGARVVPENVTYLLNQPDKWQDAIGLVFN